MKKTWLVTLGVALAIVGAFAVHRNATRHGPTSLETRSLKADTNADDIGTATNLPQAGLDTSASDTVADSLAPAPGSGSAELALPGPEEPQVYPAPDVPEQVFPALLSLLQESRDPMLRDMLQTNEEFRTSAADRWSDDMQSVLRAFITSHPDVSNVQWSADCRVEMCVVQLREFNGRPQPPATSPAGAIVASLREQSWMSQLRAGRLTKVMLKDIPHVYLELLRIR